MAGTTEIIAPVTLIGTVTTFVKTHPEVNKATITIMNNFFTIPPKLCSPEFVALYINRK